MKNIYINIQGLPKSLTKEEAQRNIILMQKGDMEARQRLIEGNIRLVIFLVNDRFSHLSFEKEELIEVGCIWLIKGIDTYNPNKNIELVTYASRCIINEILMLVRKSRFKPSIDSLNRLVNINSDDSSETALMDFLSSNEDLTQDYEEKEQAFIVREIVKRLPDKQRLMI